MPGQDRKSVSRWVLVHLRASTVVSLQGWSQRCAAERATTPVLVPAPQGWICAARDVITKHTSEVPITVSLACCPARAQDLHPSNDVRVAFVKTPFAMTDRPSHSVRAVEGPATCAGHHVDVTISTLSLVAEFDANKYREASRLPTPSSSGSGCSPSPPLATGRTNIPIVSRSRQSTSFA